MALTSVPGDAGRSTKTGDLGPAIWAAVVVAIVAAIALAFVAVAGDDEPATVPTEHTPGIGTLFNPHASDAIERRALAELRAERAAWRQELGSITAIDHLAEAAVLGEDGCLRWPNGATAC